MSNKVILVDMDDVLEDLSWAWTRVLNKRYGTNVKRNDILNWDMCLAFPSLTHEQVYGLLDEEDFYDELRPLEGAAESLKALKDMGHTVYIVTATSGRSVRAKMEKCLFRYFPFLTWQDVIITWNKHLIKGDILIDDGVHNLIDGDYAKILFSAPYNRDFDAEANGMIRVENWTEAMEAVAKLLSTESET